MTYTLTFDLGNTNQSFSLFEKSGQCLCTLPIDSLKDVRNQYKLKNENTNVIISSVKDSKIDLLDLGDLSPLYARDRFQKGSYYSMPVSYSQTLGDDRLFSSFYLFKTNKESCLLIDTGTFTTVDYISSQGLEGGYILPGLKLLSECYNQGENLQNFIPRPEELRDSNAQIPHDSKEAIRQGILKSYLSPLFSIIEERNPQKIMLTGGNSKLLSNLLQEKLCGASIHLENNLLHRSLCFIANYKD